MNEGLFWLTAEVAIGEALERLESQEGQESYIGFLRSIYNRIVYTDRGTYPTYDEVRQALDLARTV